jgi:YYY domain-containing protein
MPFISLASSKHARGKRSHAAVWSGALAFIACIAGILLFLSLVTTYSAKTTDGIQHTRLQSSLPAGSMTSIPRVTSTPTIAPTPVATAAPTAVPTTTATSGKALSLTSQEQATDNTTPPLWQTFSPQSLAVKLAVPLWWLVAELLGFLAFPALFLATPGLHDRGWGIAKALGLLLVGYVVWLLVSLHAIEYTRATVWLVLLVLALGSAGLYWLQRHAIVAFLRERWRLVLGSEALFLIAFLVFAFLRAQDPSTWHPVPGGSEKSMEMAFTDGLLRSRTFPPADPWFAGGYINYYYYGQYLFTVLVQLTGVIPTTAFNLMIALLFALTASGLFSVGYSLTKRWWVGILTVWLGIIAGNLEGATQFLHQMRVLITTGKWVPFNYFAAAFIIPQTDNEFPNFSYQWADLHAHLIDLSFAAVALGLIAALLLMPQPTSWRQRLPLLAIGALVLGSMGCINTWDFPTYVLLVAAALLLSEQQRLQHNFKLAWLRNITWGQLIRPAAAILGMAGASILLFLPYYLSYQNFYGTRIAYNNLTQLTSATQMLTIYLLAFGVAGTFLLIDFYDRLTTSTARHRRWSSQRAFQLVAIMALFLAITALEPVVLMAALLTLTVALGLDERHSVPKRFVYLILLVSFAILIGIEFFHIVDFYNNRSAQRFNTVFKFGEQVWLLLATAMPVAVWQIGERLFLRSAAQDAPTQPRLPATPALQADARLLRWGLVVGFALILGAMTIFPIETAFVRSQQRTTAWAGVPQEGSLYAAPSLDGFAYMSTWYPGDAEAITWLNEHVSGIPVIVEAAPRLNYTRDSRVSIYTGLPTVLGWYYDEGVVWRDDTASAGQRLSDVTALYEDGSPATVMRIVATYHVKYIYVGQLECLQYGLQAPHPDFPSQSEIDACAAQHSLIGPLAAFGEMAASGQLQIAYQNSDVTIYEVPG